MDLKERFQGSFMGLAVCDALGHPNESKYPGTFKPVTKMEPSAHFGNTGLWTDDTSQALCLTVSLLECGGFEADNALKYLLKWYREGFMSSRDHAFGSGSGTRRALERYETSGKLYDDHTPPARGNGCIMRLTPVVMATFKKGIDVVNDICEESCKITHGSMESTLSTTFMSQVLFDALSGARKEDILRDKKLSIPIKFLSCPSILDLCEGQYKTQNPPRIKADRNAIGCLEAALWAFYNTNNFKDGALAAVNLGHDTDTVGAVYGQIAGAFYGYKAIPKGWINKIYQPELINNYSELLYKEFGT